MHNGASIGVDARKGSCLVMRLAKGETVEYKAPTLIDYGSISEHTFTRCGGTGPKIGGSVGFRDKFCECSHTTGVDQCDS